MKYVGATGAQFRTRKQQHQRHVKNKIAINGIYNHLKHNRKHKLPGIMQFTYIMNLKKGVKTTLCWNKFNSEVQKSLKK